MALICCQQVSTERKPSQPALHITTVDGWMKALLPREEFATHKTAAATIWPLYQWILSQTEGRNALKHTQEEQIYELMDSHVFITLSVEMGWQSALTPASNNKFYLSVITFLRSLGYQRSHIGWFRCVLVTDDVSEGQQCAAASLIVNFHQMSECKGVSVRRQVKF